MVSVESPSLDQIEEPRIKKVSIKLKDEGSNQHAMSSDGGEWRHLQKSSSHVRHTRNKHILDVTITHDRAHYISIHSLHCARTVLFSFRPSTMADLIHVLMKIPCCLKLCIVKPSTWPSVTPHATHDSSAVYLIKPQKPYLMNLLISSPTKPLAYKTRVT